MHLSNEAVKEIVEQCDAVIIDTYTRYTRQLQASEIESDTVAISADARDFADFLSTLIHIKRVINDLAV